MRRKARTRRSWGVRNPPKEWGKQTHIIYCSGCRCRMEVVRKFGRVRFCEQCKSGHRKEERLQRIQDATKRCYFCIMGFPLVDGVHRGSQELGAIAPTPCKEATTSEPT